MIPVARPLLPSADAILPYLRRIDATRIYSNFGPLTRELEARLAAHFGLPPDCAVSAANGTAGLAAALSAVTGGGDGYCLLPSWTFCASGHAITAAGFRPYFLDVDGETWRLRPEMARRALAKLESARAIMPVAPFGAAVDVALWDEFSSETGTPVVIDAAAGFAQQRIGEAPVVVSLHATKILGAGEGAVVLARDPELITEVTRRLNFGFHGTRSAKVTGFNGKMSEYCAAAGLAAMDVWPETLASWSALKARYEGALDRAGIRCVGPTDAGVASTLVYRFCGDAADLSNRLTAARVGSRLWYNGGCHAEPCFRDCCRDPLPVTAELASSCLGLPFFRDLDDQDLARVVAALSEALGEQTRAQGATVTSSQ